MREELLRTLGYAPLARWRPVPEQVLAAFDRWSVACAVPLTQGTPGLTCSDPDDQVFLDLGLAQPTRWLVTHDRALLRLARAARHHGLRVVRPAAGTAELSGL
jgi:predicted nucleic acid-binding protein